MSSSVHTNNKKKDILILGIGPMQGLDDITLTPKAKYSINFSRSNKKFCLSLHYNESNSFLFVKATKIYQFKAKDWEIKIHPLCLKNISSDFSASNMKKEGLNRCVYDFSIYYRAFGTNNIVDISKYKIHDILFIGLLTGLFNGSNHTKCVLLSNQKCMIQPTLINSHPNKYSQELHYYPFAVTLDRFFGSYNTLNDSFNKVCVPNKTKELNIHALNLITGKNQLKILAEDISCEFKCKFDERKCNSN